MGDSAAQLLLLLVPAVGGGGGGGSGGPTGGMRPPVPKRRPPAAAHIAPFVCLRGSLTQNGAPRPLDKEMKLAGATFPPHTAQEPSVQSPHGMCVDLNATVHIAVVVAAVKCS